ncbi:transposase, partial [Chloroflexus sp.]|uniref:transposase n=1 Tax=Chloroflexus sp. TaxID=1904827 RepID=UPI00404B6DFC
MTRTAYPSDGSDEAWAFVAPSVTLMDEAAPQRNDPLRAVANGLRSILRTGAPWRMLPTDVPPWPVVDHQPQRWLTAGVVAQMVHDVRMLVRDITDRAPHPRAVIVDSRTLPSTPERG